MYEHWLWLAATGGSSALVLLLLLTTMSGCAGSKAKKKKKKHESQRQRMSEYDLGKPDDGRRAEFVGGNISSYNTLAIATNDVFDSPLDEIDFNNDNADKAKKDNKQTPTISKDATTCKEKNDDDEMLQEPQVKPNETKVAATATSTEYPAEEPPVEKQPVEKPPVEKPPDVAAKGPLGDVNKTTPSTSPDKQPSAQDAELKIGRCVPIKRLPPKSPATAQPLVHQPRKGKVGIEQRPPPNTAATDASSVESVAGRRRPEIGKCTPIANLEIRDQRPIKK